MNFPCWFSFASMMMFCNSKNITVGSLCSEYATHDLELTCPAEAANFIAWILYPTSESTQLLMVDYLAKISDLWSQEFSSLNKCPQATNADKEAKKAKLHVKKRLASQELDSCAVALWLKEYRDMHVKLFREKVGLSTSNTKGFSVHQNLMFRRIPLGILLLHPSHLSKEACSLLLHYASTGTVEEFSGIQNPKLGRKRLKRDSLKLSIGEAIAGCRSVFEITDVAESISQSMFTEEEAGLNFVCEVKMKTCNYLLQCAKRFVEMEVHEGGVQMRRDLLTRVIRWRHQGKDVFQNNKDLDFVSDALDV